MRVFVFGSSVTSDGFYDIDVGIDGDVRQEEIVKLKDEFYESTFPYKVDVVNFNEVKEGFKSEVLKSKIVWIKK